MTATDAAPVDDPSRTAPRARMLLPKGRLEAFADGVFAIVITLIVLELEVPPKTEGAHLLTSLFHEWRSFAAYLISFVFVGGVWIAHAGATRLIAQTDDVLMRLNLVVLFFVSFLPFTTSVMATHLSGSGENTAVALYGLNLLIASVVLNVFVFYGARRGSIASGDVAEDELRQIERRRRILVLGQALATAIAIVLPGLAVGAYLAISISFIVAPLLRAQRPTR